MVRGLTVLGGGDNFKDEKSSQPEPHLYVSE